MYRRADGPGHVVTSLIAGSPVRRIFHPIAAHRQPEPRMRRLAIALAATSLLACHGGSDPSDADFRSVRAAGGFTCSVRVVGGESCWGAVHPELFGGREAVTAPRQAAFTPRFRQVTRTGIRHGCGLEDDGRAWCWGENFFGAAGRREGLGADGPVAPAPVESTLRFRDIASEWSSTCGVAMDGGLHCWGDARWFGADTASLPTCVVSSGRPRRCAPAPTRIALDVPVERIVMGAGRACALTDEGEAWCWGENVGSGLEPFGVLGVGDDSSEFVPAPRPVVGGLRFREVQLFLRNSVACGMVQGEGPYCWGGVPSLLPVDDADRERARTQPTPLRPSDGVTFTALAVGRGHACALDTDRRAWCWGANGEGGALGNASDDFSRTPVPVLGGLRFERLAAGDGFTCGIAADGAWCWGENGAGQLGDGSTTDRPIPVRVAGQGALD
jgi:alpha-tubulin suppressor-like RCC1 family protein